MKPKKLILLALPLLLIALVFGIFGGTKPQSISAINIPMDEKHRGVCWVGGPNVIDSSHILNVASKHVNWISQTPFGWQRGYDNPSIGTNKQIEAQGHNAWWGESDEGLKTTTRLAKAQGVKTILKPHIWLRDDAGKWRGEIEMKSEENWKKWFSEYENFILHYAQLAEEEEMEMLCIGTELHKTCVEREKDWRSLIAKVRDVYSGPLTYAANFADEFEDITFWDELDYIGVQAYFPLTENEEPTLAEVKSGWQTHIDKLEKFSARFNKPILFTEVGYKSTKDSGKEPWVWPNRMSVEKRQQIYSDETQSVLYEALFSEVFQKPFIAGFHIWKWFPTRISNSDPNREPSYHIGFTPQGKPAEKVMTDWFSKFSD